MKALSIGVPGRVGITSEPVRGLVKAEEIEEDIVADEGVGGRLIKKMGNKETDRHGRRPFLYSSIISGA